jgi:hypothetical protein
MQAILLSLPTVVTEELRHSTPILAELQVVKVVSASNLTL